MADKAVGQLPRATEIQLQDLFVLEQSGEAKSLTGQTLMVGLAEALDGHGGISNITYTPPTPPSLDGTLTITYADNSTPATFSVKNGRGITSFTSQPGSNQTTEYTLNYNDGSTTSFEVQDGRSIVSITKTATVGLTDTYTITYNRGANSTFTVKNGREITSVAKTSTDGLTDNYTISFNDNTTEGFSVDNGRGISDFTSADDSSTGTSGNGISHIYTVEYNDGSPDSVMTIRDGLKGDTGAQTYVHVAWADTGDNPPSLDNQIDTSNPSPWIGICSNTSSTDPQPVGNYTWYKYKGATGDTGAYVSSITPNESQPPAQQLTTNYDVNFSNGTTLENQISVKDGNGIASITAQQSESPIGYADAGKIVPYTITFTNGTTYTFRVYNGADGQGGVSTVSGIQPIAGDVEQVKMGTTEPTTAFPGIAKQLYIYQNTSQNINKLYFCMGQDGGGSYLWVDVSAGITIDTSLSAQSTNPISNAAVTARVGTAALPNSSSDLTAAVNYVNGRIPSASSSTPLADASTGSAGSSTAWSRGDHKHPFNVPSTGLPADLGVANLGSATTYAKSDHVHKKPTPSELGAVSTADVNYKIYDTVADLTLNDTALVVGSATVSDAWTALPVHSMLICDSSDFASGETPTSYGTVEIIKAGSGADTYAMFCGKESSDGTYHMYSTASGGASGTWVNVVTTNEPQALAPAAIVTGISSSVTLVASCYGYELRAKSYIPVIFPSSIMSQALHAVYLNINGTGDKMVKVDTDAYLSTLKGLYILYYDGTRYWLNTNGTIANVPYGTQIGQSTGSADLNTYTYAGIYYFTPGVTITNKPNNATRGWLTVLIDFPNQRDYVKQIWQTGSAYDATGYTEQYVRMASLHSSSLTWSSWTKMISENDASSSTPSALGTAAAGSSISYARADHVHNMPSASDVGALSPSDVQYKVYDSVTDLGLTSGSATIAGAYAALGEDEILITDGAEFASAELPSVYGTVEIVKRYSNGTRGYIYWHGKEATNGDYRMFLNSSEVPDGEWTRMIKKEDLLSMVYPVGSIYMSVVSTSPASFLGGTWARITGRFLLAATDDGSSGASQAPGNTGGAATVTLTSAQLPSVSGYVEFRKGQRESGTQNSIFNGQSSGIMSVSIGGGSTTGSTTGFTAITTTSAKTDRVSVSFGSGNSHNNMPPYLSVYIWKRTA